jgi:DNA-binding Lrp family transcriptional regulator
MKNLIIGILFISTSVFGQEFNFDIHNTSLTEYMKMEENLGSEKIPTTSNHVSFGGNAQPIKYLRKEKVIPDLTAFYFFKKADSTMSYVLYEWDVSNFEKQYNNQKSEKFQEALIAKYKGLKKEISNEFGQPKVKKNYSNISRLDSINTFVESSTWNPNDSTEIEMYATVSNYYEKKGAITINQVHRIRLYIRNQSKEKEKEIPKLDENKLAELERIKTDFFTALKAKDLPKSKEFLSDLILEKVTDEQINTLIDNINFDKQTELIYSGVQMGFNGSMFTLLQYKYSDDNSSPPSEMIKLIFDDKDKVVGIQPIKMQSKITD